MLAAPPANPARNRNQNRYLMIATHLRFPSRTVVRCGRRPSTGYGALRSNSTLADQLVHSLSLLYAVEVPRNSSLVHANVLHHQTLSLCALRNIRGVALKSP
jgi:hypothetical protein